MKQLLLLAFCVVMAAGFPAGSEGKMKYNNFNDESNKYMANHEDSCLGETAILSLEISNLSLDNRLTMPGQYHLLNRRLLGLNIYIHCIYLVKKETYYIF